MCVADNLVQVGVSRLGTYGDVAVSWVSTQRDNVSTQVTLGLVRPPSGSVTLTNGQNVAVFFVEVILEIVRGVHQQKC